MYKLYNCYEECGKYFDELVELGRKAIDQGENGGETMNLIGRLHCCISPQFKLLTDSRPDA